MAPPFREAEFEILYGTGINRTGELIDLATACGLVEKSGAWFAVDGERVAQGRDKMGAFLVENPAIAESLRARLLTGMKGAAVPAAIPPGVNESEDDGARVAAAN